MYVNEPRLIVGKLQYVTYCMNCQHGMLFRSPKHEAKCQIIKLLTFCHFEYTGTSDCLKGLFIALEVNHNLKNN